MKKGQVIALTAIMGIVMMMTILSGCSQPVGAVIDGEIAGAKLLATFTPTSTPDVVIPLLWSSSKTYTAGDLVRWNEAVWKAKWWTQGEEPGTVEWGPWEWQYTLPPITLTPTPEITPTITVTPTPTPTCSCGTEPWDPAKVYSIGDIIVCPDGRVFQAKWWTTGGDNPCDNYDPWGPWEQIG